MTEEAQSIYQQNFDILMKASRLSLAPMMDYTDRHFRHVVRLLSRNVLLYTEMVAVNVIVRARASSEKTYREANPQATDEEVRLNCSDYYLRRFLEQGHTEPLEGPSVLQLGGSDPDQMFQAAQIIMELTERGVCNFTAINLNCGCPSPKVVGRECFGAALMEDPGLVAILVRRLYDGCGGRLPVTVKCRIGTFHPEGKGYKQSEYDNMDQEEEYRNLCNFIETVASSGIVTHFIVHARVAVVKRRFSPSENRTIPPLKHHLVYRLVEDYPQFTFELNGGVETLEQAQQHFAACTNLHGVMIGRAFVADPWRNISMADSLIFGQDDNDTPPLTRLRVLKQFGEHADAEEACGIPANIRRFITKAVSQLFVGELNSKLFRVALDKISRIPRQLKAEGKTMAGQPPLSEIILEVATKVFPEDVLLRSPEESYDRMLKKHRQQKAKDGERSRVVQEWQERRKEEAQALAITASDFSQNQSLAKTATATK